MSQSAYNLYYHIVWGTKYRKLTITLMIEEWLKEFIPNKVQLIGGESLELNMYKDHLHLLTSILPKITVANFISNLKGSSSHYINTMLQDKCFYWQPGYFVSSVSEKDIPTVRNYIKNQKKRHQNNALMNNLKFIPED